MREDRHGSDAPKLILRGARTSWAENAGVRTLEVTSPMKMDTIMASRIHFHQQP